MRVKDQSKAVEAYLERISDFPKLLLSNPVNVTDDMIELYLELLCQYERNSVLKFLETFDSYRVEHCLRLCQKYVITDAASFLLERVGDVGSALLLTLSTLGDKFIKLDTAVASLVSSNSAHTEHFSNALKLEEDTAKSLIEDDTFYTMSILKKGASHGYAPRSQICCLCDCLLDTNSSSYIRIFNCGHATHLQCEALENGASSSSSSSGCPVCMRKKKSQRSRSKSVLPDKSLVKEFLSRSQQTHGTTAHPQESSASENTDGFQQISRFDILTNLQRDRGLVEIDNMPQLRLAPPAVYHEKVQKGTVLSPADSSTDLLRIEKQSKGVISPVPLKIKHDLVMARRRPANDDIIAM